MNIKISNKGIIKYLKKEAEYNNMSVDKYVTAMLKEKRKLRKRALKVNRLKRAGNEKFQKDIANGEVQDKCPVCKRDY